MDVQVTVEERTGLSSVAALYAFFSGRRRLLAGLVLVLWAVSLAVLSTMRVDEDIRAMIPDEPSEAARQFRLLQQSPLSGKLLIQVSAGEGVSTSALLTAVDRLAQAMGPPRFRRVLTGPPVTPGGELIPFLTRSLPSLFTETDRSLVLELLEPERIRGRLEEILAGLRSPEGWAHRAFTRRDPLGLGLLTLEKLRHVSPIPEVRVVDGHFLSLDGRHALLIAETPVAMTDAERGGDLISGFDELAREALPAGVAAFLYGGHLYTVANAETVRSDLFLVLSVSSAALVLLFIAFIRSWNGLLLLLVPASTLLIAAAGTAAVCSPVSAVTLGFGAVLLGISIDFGIHVYFALRRFAPERAAEVTGRIAVPILFGGATTMAAFAVLLTSSISGQRQLGLFSLIGMASALALSLVALPQWIRPAATAAPARGVRRRGARSRWVVWVWIAILGLAGWQASRLEFQGDLRALNQAPDRVRKMEAALARTWGDLLGRTLLVADGPDLASALEVNDCLYARLEELSPGSRIMSLAPLLPSPQVQQANRTRWRELWSPNRIQVTRETLDQAGRELGFSASAFDPFFAWLGAEASPVGVQDLKQAGLGEILKGFLLQSEDGVRVLSLAPEESGRGLPFFEALRDTPEVHVVSPAAFGDMISRALSRDFLGFILGAGGAVLLLLGLLLRNPVRVGLCLIPVVTGLAASAGGMAALGAPFNAFNTVAAVLILGLGVDYGVFMVLRPATRTGLGTERAVLVSGLTTLAGFGALALAAHPALHAIGVTVLLGIGAAVPAALLVIPALTARREE